MVKKISRYSVGIVNKYPNYVFVFGDNLIKKGTAGQAQIRFCKNALGIPTKKLPSMESGSFFNDDEFEENIVYFTEALDRIPLDCECVIFPKDGLGTGLADLPTKAPRTYRALVDMINKRFGKVYE